MFYEKCGIMYTHLIMKALNRCIDPYGGRTEMFFYDSLKGLKKELKTTGTDMAFVKEWQKQYDKLRKQYPVLERQYIKTKTDLKLVLTALQKIEQVLISLNDSSAVDAMQQKISGGENVLKKYQNNFLCEFLIGKEDQEFHSTLSAIISLCEKDMRDKQVRLILQSEVENLMVITKEALEKHWPDFRALAYFYMGHTDQEILELPHAEKVDLVQRMYQDEFYHPMKQVLENAFGVERADKIMEVELWI